MISNYLILIASWIIYFTIHSILASRLVKEKIKQYSPAFFKYYRIVYNIIAFLGLIIIFAISTKIPIQKIGPTGSFTKYTGLIFATWGLLVIRQSFKTYSIKSFIGINKEKKGPLIVKGILTKVRHPIYSGTILLFLGYFIFTLNTTSLITFLMVLIYIPLGIQFEETKLIQSFGNDYLEYRKKTPALIPKIRL